MNNAKTNGKKARSRRRPRSKTAKSTPTIRPYAAGIDVGATELYVAVPEDLDSMPVRTFATFTEDLHALADWLETCRIQTVALESTGVYWIPVYQILEERGLDVCLVNARHVKNAPGRKTDVSDCQWLQYLHSVGLLRASFRPPQQVCAVRSLWRERETLVKDAARKVQHMQKALFQMNIQLSNVISDITGKTGLDIIDAILTGERDVDELSKYRDHRIKADKRTIAKSLRGDWREEHLFSLKMARDIYGVYREKIAECDHKIEAMLRTFESRLDPAVNPIPAKTTTHVKPTRNEANFDLRTELYRIFGMDLTQVPAIQSATVSIFLSEVGPSVERFENVKRFASWLGLCPDNRITGGRVLSARTRDVKSRLAYALRIAVQSLHRSQTVLGEYFRRMRARLGAPEAITAAAHKLARILYHLVKNRCPYDASVFAKEEELHRQRRQKYLQKQASALGFQLIPA
jgi:transposase